MPVRGKGKSTVTNSDSSRYEGKETTNSLSFLKASVVYLVFGRECHDRDMISGQSE